MGIDEPTQPERQQVVGRGVTGDSGQTQRTGALGRVGPQRPREREAGLGEDLGRDIGRFAEGHGPLGHLRELRRQRARLTQRARPLEPFTPSLAARVNTSRRCR